jgi:hypothetical protein
MEHTKKKKEILPQRINQKPSDVASPKQQGQKYMCHPAKIMILIKKATYPKEAIVVPTSTGLA